MIHLFWLQTAAKYLMRSWRSTSVMMFMIITAVATLIFLSSLATGINDAMIENSVTLYSGHITVYGLTGNTVPDDLHHPSVTDVLKRSFFEGILKKNKSSERVFFIGINPESEKKRTALEKRIIAGRYPDTGKKEILISEFISERLMAEIDHNLIFNEYTESYPFKVVGIYKTGLGGLDKEFCFIPEDTVELKTEIWNASVFIKKGIKTDQIVNIFKKKIGSDVKIISWQKAMPDLKQLIDLNGISMLLITIIVFILISIGISCAFTIFILNNLKGYGIMKSMGMTPFETCELFFYKVFLLNLVAVFAGILTGVLVTSVYTSLGIDFSEYTSHNQYFTVSGIVYPRLTVISVLFPPFLSLLFSLFAFIWPALIVIRKNTTDILRSI